MKKHTTKKLNTKLEKIRALVADEIGRINGGNTLPIQNNDNDDNVTGCPCHTLVP